MQKRNFIPRENPYYRNPEGPTSLTQNFSRQEYYHLFYKFKNFTFFNMLLSYDGELSPSTDLFEYMSEEEIKQVNSQNTFIIFDATFEGFSQETKPLIAALSFSAKKYNINPKKIFLFTGNFLDDSEEINVIPIFILDLEWSWGGHSLTFSKSKEDCKNNYEKLILSLSRRNRPLRVMAHFALYNSSISNECIISQDRLGPSISLSNETLEKLNLSNDDWEKFKEALPLIADEDNFHINTPFDPLPFLHSKTLFSIVNETLINNYNNTSLFFSEKLLKPIINYQPMVIYGQPGINKKISMLGFKTYENYFDLSFDDEEDDVIRYKKLLLSITETTNYLKSLTRDQQIEWRYKEKELLEYNYTVFTRRENTKKQLELFVKKLESTFLTSLN